MTLSLATALSDLLDMTLAWSRDRSSAGRYSSNHDESGAMEGVLWEQFSRWLSAVEQGSRISLAQKKELASVYEKKSVTIVEIMGRHAGWLTAAGALARKYTGDNPLLIYLPETAFDTEEFLARVNASFEKNCRPDTAAVMK